MASFTAVAGKDKRELHFVYDDREAPVKLGDGTFGCVFHVQDAAHQNYALKIFYESDDEFVLESQKEEMELGEKLRVFFKDQIQRINEIDRYLAVSKALVEDFKSSKAYEVLKGYFEDLAFKVSNRAIVMDIYPLSLKDVLERGWPKLECMGKAEKVEPGAADAEELGRGLGGVFGDEPGYSILRRLPQREREKCILPLVRQLAEALSILQEAKYNHQDIKPANVLLRKVGPQIEVALADLGFVNTGQFQVAGSIFQMQPLGTRHYRSPEQTDFFDVCEVDIRSLEDGDYELVTDDPKFHETFSEPGDLVVFSKLPEPIQWCIESISFETLENGLSVASIRIKGLPGNKLHEDVRTQITINKRQTDRTDIFGLGAIIFDMLTCGRSPEQFYNLLRIHDKMGKIDKGLAQRYVHFRNGGGTVPEIDAIFQNMRVDANSAFPHPDMVRIILKCMMSKPLDSYWNCGKWASIKRDLDVLMEGLDCFQYSQARYNHLIKSGDLPIDLVRPKASPEKELNEIQGLSYSNSDQCVKRLVLGIRYLNKIAQMVGTEMAGGGDVSYLANISPRSLAEHRNAFVPKLALFEKEVDFDAVVESGNPRALVQLFSAGGLRPPFIDGLVREGEVWVSSAQQNGERQGNFVYFGYELWGRDGKWSWEKNGDFRLLLDLSATDRINRKIVQVDSSKGVLHVSGEDDLAKRLSVDAGRYRAYFVKKFDRDHYYLSMLGAYIRLIFFVDPARRQTHTPQSIYFFEEGRSLDRTKFEKFRLFPKSSVGRKRSLNDLFFLMAGIYARLLTLELEGAPARSVVDRFVGRLKDDIFKALGCSSRDELMNEAIDDLIRRNGSLTLAEFPDIDQLVNANIVVSKN